MLVNVAECRSPGTATHSTGRSRSQLSGSENRRPCRRWRAHAAQFPATAASNDRCHSQWIREGAQRCAATATPQSPATISAIDRRSMSKSSNRRRARSSCPPMRRSIRRAIQHSQRHADAQRRRRQLREGNEVAVAPLTSKCAPSSPRSSRSSSPRINGRPTAINSRSRARARSQSADRSGGAIDGDHDGTPGGNFVMHFELGRSL